MGEGDSRPLVQGPARSHNAAPVPTPGRTGGRANGRTSRPNSAGRGGMALRVGSVGGGALHQVFELCQLGPQVADGGLYLPEALLVAAERHPGT